MGRKFLVVGLLCSNSKADKIYKVIHIDFCNLAIETIQIDLSIDGVPEDEIFPVEEFREFRVRLINDGGDKKSDVKY